MTLLLYAHKEHHSSCENRAAVPLEQNIYISYFSNRPTMCSETGT